MTTSENRGYSTLLIARVAKMDSRLITVKLAKACFRHNVPVSAVATTLGVSRASVYSWFKGDAYPRKGYVPKIEALVAKLG